MAWMSAAKQLWRDERGMVSVLTMVLITAVLTLGGIVGLAAVREQLTQQLGDASVALDNLDQSFSYTVTVDGGVVLAATYSDPTPTLDDPVDDAPACLDLTQAPGAETDPLIVPVGSLP